MHSTVPYLEVVSTQQRLIELKEQWRALFAESDNSSIALSWEWVSLWWEHFGKNNNAALLVALCWHGDKLAAVAPLYREKLAYGTSCLRFISSTSGGVGDLYPEYTGILTHRVHGDSAEERLAHFIASSPEFEVDLLQLDRLRPASAMLDSLRLKKSFSDFISQSELASPYADLREGFDTYLARLSRNSRSRFRRLLREARDNNITLEISQSVQSRLASLSNLIDRHQQVWKQRGEPGAFADPTVCQFHRSLVQMLEPEVAVLAAIRQGDQILSQLYGFCCGEQFEFYQSATPPTNTQGSRSPGILAHLLLMQHLIPKGIRKYNFLAGPAAYKLQMATDSDTLISYRSFRPSLPGILRVGSRAVREWL